MGMTLDQLEILIQVAKEDLSSDLVDSDDLALLIKDQWVNYDAENDEYSLTERGESRVNLILAMPSGPPVDEIELENHCKMITYEIETKVKKRTKEFLKSGQIRIPLHARPEVMNELVTRYSKDGWEAAHENGSICLTWAKISERKAKHEN